MSSDWIGVRLPHTLSGARLSSKLASQHLLGAPSSHLLTTIMVLPDERLLPYTRSNEPLPISLREPLHKYLAFLAEGVGEYNATSLRLEAEIRRLQEHWETNGAKKSELLTEYNHFKGLNSAVRRLPPVVVSSVLRYALSWSGGARMLSKPDREFFSGLRRVCRSWRAAANATPDLWRHLDVDVGGELLGNVPSMQLAAKFQAWFARGGPCGHLSLRLSGWRHSGHSVAAIIACLDQPGLSFETLCLEDEYTEPSQMVSLLQPIDAFQNTKNVTLNFDELGRNSAAPETWRPMANIFPALESLTLDARVPLRVLFPHQHIVSLHLNNNPFYIIYPLASALPSMPSLEELILRFDGLDRRSETRAYRDQDSAEESDSDREDFELDEANRPPAVAHPFLKRLIVTSALPLRLLMAFTFPSLELFRLSGPMQHIEGMFYYLRNFVNRSNGPHLTLDLSSTEIPNVDLERIFVNLKSLQALYLGNPRKIFEPGTEEFWSTPALPPTQMDTIVFTAHCVPCSVDAWSKVMARRFAFPRQTMTAVYFFGESGAEADGPEDSRDDGGESCPK
ncbi:hypothetical protein BKA70DRAFT_1558940 [Coprinopsis sp. MPI-PUGE-AT-0042]|nr:hypothetical protein BKA70DRAFT_1558940 [Coprinopsis sp. MPI-PUGE-AT-0042]